MQSSSKIAVLLPTRMCVLVPTLRVGTREKYALVPTLRVGTHRRDAPRPMNVVSRTADAERRNGCVPTQSVGTRGDGCVPTQSVGIRLWLAAAVAVALFAGGAADGAERVNWATGTALQQNLAASVDIFWADNPLRAAVKNLSEARRVAVLVDRRVDPGQKLDIALRGVSLDEGLHAIARSRGLGIARLGAVVFLGPTSASERLDAVASAFERETQRQPSAVARKYRLIKRLFWDDFASPRELLARLAAENGLEIVNIEAVPHDLWAGADLPPLSLVERLTLIAVQFDLTFKVSDRGARLELVPIPADVPRVSKGDRPAARRPAKPMAGTPLPPIDRITIREKPLGPVLEQLAARLGLELKIDREAIAAAGISLDRRVSVQAEKLSVDELLDRLLDGTGLKFERRQRMVKISPNSSR